MANVSERILEIFTQHLGKTVGLDRLLGDLDITRNTLLKQINTLQKRGHLIEADGTQGFLLKPFEDALTPEEIQTYLKTNFIGQDLHYYPELDSSLDTAFRLATQYPIEEESMTPLRKIPKEGSTEIVDTPVFAGNGSVVVTEVSSQDCSLWSSECLGLNLYASIVLRPGILPTRAPQIALVAMVALARVIETMSGVRCTLRWPKELAANGKSLAKIKVEMQSNIDKISFLILGFEVNLNGLAESLNTTLNETVTSVRILSGKTINRPLFAASLFRELEKWYITYINKGAEKIVREASQFLPYLNKETNVVSKGKTYRGVVESLDPDGTLVLRTDSGEIIRIAAADIPITY